jgi:3-hydroxybutyryl-CoA dehydrogenase
MGENLASLQDIQSVAVLGSGTMGHGIAQVAAMAGYRVSLYDIESGILDKAVERIRGNLDKGVERGKVSEEVRSASIARISTTTQIESAVGDAQLVIEAAPESMDLKREIFSKVDAAAPADAIFATNTSSLSVAQIADIVARPARVVGMHFFNPVHIMKLVEVVAHEGSDPGAVQVARGVAEKMGKTAITVKDAPGFASSRLGLVLGLEAMRMVEQGVASAADIDTAMKLGYGHPMGPLELTDLVGLDVRLSIADYLVETVGDVFRAPQVLRDKVAAGHLGKKTGQGFYRWVDGKRAD